MHRVYGLNRSVLVIILLAWSCGARIALFDQRAYEHATSLKAEASVLMDQATQDFSGYTNEVRVFMTRVEMAYEYANGIPKNERSAAQWRIMKGEDLLGGFFELGKAELIDHAEDLLKDGQDFAEETAEDLKTWTQQLAAGEMSEAEFRLALRGKKAVAKMEALKQLGLAEIEIDRLRGAIIDTVVRTAAKAFLA